VYVRDVHRIAAIVILGAATAWADPVPDASLRAVTDRAVRLELDDARSVDGRVLAFDATTVTLAASGTNEVISVPRGHVQHVFVSDFAVPGAPEPERHRMWGVHFGFPGTLVGDVDYRWLHAFASPNVMLPILTASGESRWYSAAIGAGISIPLSSRWRFDAFGETMPLHYTSFYTYLATGLGVGFHRTGTSGISVGFTLPIIGFAARLGHSPYGYDAPFRYNDSLSYFYLAGFTTMPLVTLGYRFPCRRPL